MSVLLMLFALPAAWFVALLRDLQIQREGLDEEEAKSQIYEAVKVIVKRYNDQHSELDDLMHELRMAVVGYGDEDPKARALRRHLTAVLGAEVLGVGHGRFAVRVPRHSGPRGDVPGFVVKISRGSTGDYANKQEVALWRHAVAAAAADEDDQQAAALVRHLLPPLLHALSFNWLVFQEVVPASQEDRPHPWGTPDMWALGELKDAGVHDLHAANVAYVDGVIKAIDYAYLTHPADAWVREEIDLLRQERDALMKTDSRDHIWRRFGSI